MVMSEQENSILIEFKRRIEKRYPGEIARIMIYGSKARGDATEESDIDVLVVSRFDDWKKADAIRAIGYSLDIEIGSKLSIQVLPEKHLDHLRAEGFQFIENVDREGVLI
jgi:predicted nucleotidyltransferase